MSDQKTYGQGVVIPLANGMGQLVPYEHLADYAKACSVSRLQQENVAMARELRLLRDVASAARDAMRGERQQMWGNGFIVWPMNYDELHDKLDAYAAYLNSEAPEKTTGTVDLGVALPPRSDAADTSQGPGASELKGGWCGECTKLNWAQASSENHRCQGCEKWFCREHFDKHTHPPGIGWLGGKPDLCGCGHPKGEHSGRYKFPCPVMGCYCESRWGAAPEELNSGDPLAELADEALRMAQHYAGRMNPDVAAQFAALGRRFASARQRLASSMVPKSALEEARFVARDVCHDIAEEYPPKYKDLVLHVNDRVFEALEALAQRHNKEGA